MNTLCAAGRLGNDGELKRLPNGDAICTFSIADDQGQNKPTIWWRCALFGKRAESLAKHLVKGAQVTITGNVTEREYKNRDGVTVRAQEINVRDVALQGAKRGGVEGFQGGTGARDTDFDDDLPPF